MRATHVAKGAGGRPAGYSIDVRVSAYVSADRLRINPSAVLAAEK